MASQTHGRDARVDQTLGHYRIIEKIGAGGMGEVYRAHDEQLDRDVALKVLPPASFGDAKARARLLREARAAAALNHPSVCTAHEVGEADGQTYLAMELVEGQTLSARLAGGAIPIDEVLRYGQQIAGALAHAHERGVVHRDLKTANVVITPDGRAKVLDFGLAKRLSSDELMEAVTRSEASLTQPGALVGTVPCMSPEQLRAQPADARSDIWALGIVLHEMASGARPFQARTAFELTSAILNDPPIPLPGKVPVELRAVIGRCLEKEPGRRYQRGAEVQAALQAVQSGTVPPWAAWRFQFSRRRWLMLISALLIVLLVGAFLLRNRIGGEQARAVRLAVLPFANLTGDPEQEYLSDGLTQEMIAQLGRLHPGGLSVIARTSIMRYTRTDKPIDQIGRELGVDYILEGSARREAGRVRVSAELIQVRDQAQLWAETYERELAGIMALQAEVARKVAESLVLRLLPAEQTQLAKVRAVNPEAYEAYLKGLHHWYKLTPGDLDSAQQYFELALKKDPNYALAYAGLSLAWAGRNQMGIVPPREAAPKAKAAALKAVELDDNLAEAHYALAIVKSWHDWDLPEADVEWKRAIELNPNFPDARAFYSHYLTIMRRPDEAMPQIQRALELDPFNALFQSLYAFNLESARRWDDAITVARKALSTAPDNPAAQSALENALFAKGMYKEALAVWKMLYPGDREVGEALDRGYAEGGYTGAVKRAAQVLAARGKDVDTFVIAVLYQEAGEKALALDWYEKAYNLRDPNMPYLGEPPACDIFRSEPRYHELLRRMKIPP